MVRIQMMEQVAGPYQEAARSYTSLRKMALKMKPALQIEDKPFYFIGIYKGFLNGLHNENLLKFIVVDKQGEIVTDVQKGFHLVTLYSLLLRIWVTKTHIKGFLNGYFIMDQEEIPYFMKAIERTITSANENIDDYRSSLSKLKEICSTKPKKRKKLPYNMNELKQTLYKPYNILLEANGYNIEQLLTIYQAQTDLTEIELTNDWRETLSDVWVHY